MKDEERGNDKHKNVRFRPAGPCCPHILAQTPCCALDDAHHLHTSRLPSEISSYFTGVKREVCTIMKDAERGNDKHKNVRLGLPDLVFIF